MGKWMVFGALALALSACGRPTQKQNLAFDSSGGNPDTGRALYLSNSARCFVCHGNDGRGGRYPVDIRSASATKIAAALRNGPGDMPQYTVSDQTILELIAFINTL